MDKKIRALVMDVDGTLTDGVIYIGDNGEIMKGFSAKDGYGIHELLPESEIVPVILTGRKSKIVENRCKELGITYLIQNSKNKVWDLEKVCNKLEISPLNVAYIGDDMNDYEAMMRVGLRGCPCDAVDEIKQISEFVCKKPGGKGAVREFIEWIIKNNKE